MAQPTLHTKDPTRRFGTVAPGEGLGHEAARGWIPDLIAALVPCLPTVLILLSLTLVDAAAGPRELGTVFAGIMVAAGVVVLALAVALAAADRRDRLGDA